MSGKRPTPLQVFEVNLDDAHRLIEFARALENFRPYRMRKERRTRVGAALGYSKRSTRNLDWIESNHAYVIFKPDGDLDRTRFTEDALRPLLRQAVVAIAAAVESYVARRACGFIGAALRADPLPKRLDGMSISFGEILLEDRRLKRRLFGYRGLLKAHIEREASASPSKIGEVFSTVGVSGLWRAVDKERDCAPGRSEKQLDRLAKRRNKIAHDGDWEGSKRASLTLDQVEGFYRCAKEIVEAIDRAVDIPTKQRPPAQ